ncbi:bacteriocin fulvocin C-related protein [Actinokineospora auranticolor]|uniref:bacteriocin fulvocin C-related protein n=1 Tax=Actinokineospora auranticolor TaxID=155976 RepID=UPI0015E37E70|nr:bacteriocin fulvocin C-related protein [Actinokineospora auranticolor]
MEVLPLTHPDVARWRERAFTDAPWEPTLLRVDAAGVKGWHGRGMTVPLVRMLGVRSSLRIVNALGELRYGAEEARESGDVGRQRFLRLGAGVAIATGLVATGNVPAFASSDDAKARAWVAANRAALPTTYDAVVAHPLAHRRAIVQALPAKVRSELWVEQLDRYLRSRSNLSAEQVAYVREARAVAARESTFAGVAAEGSALAGRLQHLHDEGVRVLGHQEAARLIAILGPSDHAGIAAGVAGGGCTCNQTDDWCTWGYHCRSADCNYASTGCGSFNNQACNGLCFD